MVLADSSQVGLNTKDSTLMKSNFKTYTNESFGISIQYPPSWIVLETDAAPDDTVVDVAIFATSLEYLMGQESEGAMFSVSVDKLPSNMTLVDYGNNLSSWSSTNGLSNEVKFNDLKLANNPAYEIHTMLAIPGDVYRLQTLERGTIIGNKVYMFSYASEPEHFEKYFPIVQKAADSLEISQTSAPLLNGAQREQAVTTTTSYKSQKYGFNIKYPSTWTIQENLGSQLGVDLTLAMTAPQESRFDNESENILVGVTSIPASLSLKEFVTGTLDNLKQNSPSFVLIDSYEIDLSGNPAQAIIFKRGPDQFPQAVEGVQMFTVHDGKAYTITYTASSHYDKYLQAAEDIMESFRFN